MRRWRRLSSRPECPLAGPPPQDRLPGTREVHARSCWLAQGDHSFSGDVLGQPDAVAAGLAHVGWCISRSTVAVARVLGISSSNPEYGSFLCTAGRVREGRQCRGVRGRQHGSARQRADRPGRPGFVGPAHPGLPWAGRTILGGDPADIAAARARAASHDDVLLVDMPAAAQAHRVYDHYLAELASTGPADLNVCSFSLVGATGWTRSPGSCTCCHEPRGLRRILLGTEDAYAVYARAGFAPLAKPDKWMALQ